MLVCKQSPEWQSIRCGEKKAERRQMERGEKQFWDQFGVAFFNDRVDSSKETHYIQHLFLAEQQQKLLQPASSYNDINILQANIDVCNISSLTHLILSIKLNTTY